MAKVRKVKSSNEFFDILRPEDFREIARNRYKITLDMLGEMENREMRRKNVIRLTESDLHKIIRESVRKILYKRYFL